MVLQDAAEELGNFIGRVLPGLDDALARIGDDDWAIGTREAVLHVVGREIVLAFDGDEELIRDLPVMRLREEARFHLARYAIAMSLASYTERAEASRRDLDLMAGRDANLDLSRVAAPVERMSSMTINFSAAEVAIAPENTPLEDFARATPGVQVVSGGGDPYDLEAEANTPIGLDNPAHSFDPRH